ncbi:MAG: insulinase family protein [Phycisphaerales bacterium]|nr:MAG: insulinase family protein [Phycisphaerales bacterium]
MTQLAHDRLPCGVEYGVVSLPHRRVVSFQIMVLAGAATEPEDRLGLAHVLGDTLDKGTELRSGRELSDAFDAIGASTGTGTGREAVTLLCTVLPEHFQRAIELHAEMLCRPTFPEDAVQVNVELARQELKALEDDAHSFMDKLISPLAFGPLLGRHPLGERETLDALSRDDLVAHWRSCFCAERMLVAVAGPVQPSQVANALEKHFSAFGESGQSQGRMPLEAAFTPGTKHHAKQLEQQHIGICWPGVGYTHEDYPVQRVTLGILAGGMSGRLFTEVREKQGLVYWVDAWHSTPRGCGMLFMGASSTPDNCAKTYETMLREVDRLAKDDIDPEELERAITGIVASNETRGDLTRSRCNEMANDLFQFGHPVPIEEKLAKVQAVTVKDVQDYLMKYPRDSLCVVTLGPKEFARP